jgi:phosphatidylinositol 4-kinase type 2
LPVSLIGQPFSKKTRDHFLPLLTSTAWWSDTQIALRRVFAQDSDFKESMFARQIAVMKGQAWNVVETLKQHDHGPLELTRRTRVCVWDDLVDIPVAIPLTRPSAEFSRRRNVTLPEQEEMDIGASRSSDSVSKPVQDLLGSPTSELPNPNRFELTRDDDAADLGRVSEETTGATSIGVHAFADLEAQQAKNNLSSSVQLPLRPSAKGKTRFSFDFSQPSPMRRTRHSKSFSAGRGSNSGLYEGDDLEGDLGYAAAGNMEGSQKKVIVERLEAVKSKNPVFTWC